MYKTYTCSNVTDHKWNYYKLYEPVIWMLHPSLCLYPQLILTHQFPFKLNGKVLEVLISIFLYHDFSVRNFIKGVQVQSSFQTCSYLSLVPFSSACSDGKQTLCLVLSCSWLCWSTFMPSLSPCCAVRRRRRCSMWRSSVTLTWRGSGICRRSRGMRTRFKLFIWQK